MKARTARRRQQFDSRTRPTCRYLTLLGNEVDHLSPIQVTFGVARDKHLAVLFAKISLDTVKAVDSPLDLARQRDP